MDGRLYMHRPMELVPSSFEEVLCWEPYLRFQECHTLIYPFSWYCDTLGRKPLHNWSYIRVHHVSSSDPGSGKSALHTTHTTCLFIFGGLYDQSASRSLSPRKLHQIFCACGLRVKLRLRQWHLDMVGLSGNTSIFKEEMGSGWQSWEWGWETDTLQL